MSAHPISKDPCESVTSVTSNNKESAETFDPVPRILHEDMTRARVTVKHVSHARSFASGFGALLFCIFLPAQYVWFHSVDMLQRFPDLRPQMEVFCQNTGCRIPVRRDPTRIQIMDRDVRAHPKYENALLVSARVVNTLPYTQPFPHIQLVLSNVNGEIIAARIFKPKEYLDRDIDLTAGMGPNKPIQVVLGILTQEEAVVSFEFTFL